MHHYPAHGPRVPHWVLSTGSKTREIRSQQGRASILSHLLVAIHASISIDNFWTDFLLILFQIIHSHVMCTFISTVMRTTSSVMVRSYIPAQAAVAVIPHYEIICL